MSIDHYFVSKEADPGALEPLQVTLNGEEVELLTAPGVFSARSLDLGTRVLLRAVPRPAKHADLLDLGCGWGPLALTMAQLRPNSRIWAVDINDRALDVTQRNAARLGLSNVQALLPPQVPADLQFATIWSNPPIRIGKPALHHLLETWLPRLSVGGNAFLVVQRNLGADSLLRWLAVQNPDFTAERFASAKGFRVLRINRLA